MNYNEKNYNEKNYNDKKYVTVTALNRYIKAKFEQDRSLQSIHIKGEISNFKHHRSGHLYFTLKDENARINCVMFSTYAKKVDFDIKDGLKVLIDGSISVYEASGIYQLYAYNIEQDGLGNLFLEFEKLKNKLLKEGLFDEQYKKTLPKYPTKIAILSSYPSAALMDITRTIKNRFPIARNIIFPVPVQGKDAYRYIIHALQQIDPLGFDLIILGRGGGSIEDLWNFNEEELARAIFACKTPVVTGIGHEIDFTIADFVADVRGATPTAAATIATPDLQDLYLSLQKVQDRLCSNIHYQITDAKKQLAHNMSYYKFQRPERLYLDSSIQLEKLDTRLQFSFDQKYKKELHDYTLYNQRLEHLSSYFILEQKKHIETLYNKLKQNENLLISKRSEEFNKKLIKLDALSPLKTMERGYSIIKKEQEIIHSASSLHSGDEVSINFIDGVKKAEIK